MVLQHAPHRIWIRHGAPTNQELQRLARDLHRCRYGLTEAGGAVQHATDINDPRQNRRRRSKPQIPCHNAASSFGDIAGRVKE